MIAGSATAEGTARYAASQAERIAPGHFRELPGGARASSVGLGTYLGREDAATDALYERAIDDVVPESTKSFHGRHHRRPRPTCRYGSRDLQ